MATSRRSLHALLGGGAVADVLLWRRRKASAASVAGATAVWFLFERAGYSLPSVVANALLLLVVVLFSWSKSASLLNRPLPPLPKLELSDAVVEKAADQALVWINRVLGVGHDIAIKRDKSIFINVSLSLSHTRVHTRNYTAVSAFICFLLISHVLSMIKVILILWAVSYIGMFFSFLTLIYIGVMFSLLVPPLYEKYQDHVDEKIGTAHRVLSRHLDTIISKTGQSTKQKKTE